MFTHTRPLHSAQVFSIQFSSEQSFSFIRKVSKSLIIFKANYKHVLNSIMESALKLLNEQIHSYHNKESRIGIKLKFRTFGSG